MRRALLAALALSACSVEVAPPPAETRSVIVPGGTADLAGALSAALRCPVSDITWSVVEPNGGTITDGVYRAPPCGTAVPGTYHIRGEGCGKVGIIPVTVAEDVISVEIVCAVVEGTGCCATSLDVPPGTAIQFYAGVTYSCPGHLEFSPLTPPAVCP